MKHILILVACLALALPTAMAQIDDDTEVPSAEPKLVDLPKNIVGSVGGQKLTVDQLQEQMFAAVTRRRDAVLPLLRRKLLDMEATAQGITVSKEEMEEARKDLIKRVGGIEDYERMVKEYRIDPMIQRINAHYQIVLKKLLDKARAKADLTVTEKEMRELYEKSRSTRYDLQVIVVPTGAAVAETLVDLGEQKSFGYVAVRRSIHRSRQNAGIILNTTAQALPPKLLGQVQKLKVGQYTDPPVEFKGNHWFIKLLAQRGPDPNSTFETEKKNIETFLRRQKEAEFARKYINTLTEKYDVQINKALFAPPSPEWKID